MVVGIKVSTDSISNFQMRRRFENKIQPKLDIIYKKVWELISKFNQNSPEEILILILTGAGDDRGGIVVVFLT